MVAVGLSENKPLLVTMTTVTMETRHVTPKMHKMYNSAEMQQRNNSTCYVKLQGLTPYSAFLWAKLRFVHYEGT